jgi:2Fe-2S ferredoxin
MPKITYIEHNGKEHAVEVPNELSLMEGAVQNNIPGIDADCGGACACATCHVYLDEKWFNKIKKKDDAEQDMLDMAFEPKQFSRLACQITITDDLDGLVVKMPSKQA